MQSTTGGHTVIFRCDATSATGLGHTSRSLALAEALVDLGCRCIFMGHFSSGARARIDAAEMACEDFHDVSWSPDDARALLRLAERSGAIGTVIDSYLVEPSYLAMVERPDSPVVVIDDFAALSHYPCSALLNFTSRATELSYPTDSVRCFLGLNWFLGRRSLRALRARAIPQTEHVRRVLVTSGGNDPFDIILPVVTALLASTDELSVHVVVRPDYDRMPELAAQLHQFRGETLVLTQLPDLSHEFAGADLCLCNAGLTKYEAAYLGIPAGVLSQNEGQAKDAVVFATLGMTVDLGMASRIDPARLTIQIGRLLADATLREQLQRNSLANFPLDPTRDLAQALLTEVFHDT